MFRSSKLAFLLAVLFVQAVITSCQGALQYNNTFYSPRNKERPFRKATTVIVLHTTEAPAASAVRKLSDQGECHFFLDTDGRIYRIIDHRRVAFHAGRSMWNGREEVDNFSIGIEVCGYHNRPITAAQMKSLAALVAEMKRVYGVQDYNVLPHSAVAYGAPNKWQRRKHRGRKRCGMLFMSSSIRLQLGLKSRPRRDPDVFAQRLVVGDPHRVRLFGRKGCDCRMSGLHHGVPLGKETYDGFHVYTSGVLAAPPSPTRIKR